MSFQDKLAQIIALIDKLNQSRSENPIDTEWFKSKLIEQGVVDEATLAYATWEVFQNAGLPLIQSKMAADIARASGNPDGTSKPFVSAKQADRMNVRELVEAYDPADKLGSAVTNRLKAITEGRKVVVFNTDGTVSVKATVDLINEKIDGLNERETYTVDGRPQPLYAIGERRNDMMDENPIFAGEALRSDGTCQRTDVSWQTIPNTIRQLVYVIVNDTHDLTANDETAHWLIETIENWAEEAESRLRRRYKQASVRLDELFGLNTPPMLKVRLNAPARTEKRLNDPFQGAGRNRRF